MGRVRDWIGVAWRAVVGALGRPWIFWPSLLVVGIVARRSSAWSSTWIQATALVLVGIVLPLTILALGRRTRRRSLPRGVERVVHHLRGHRPPI